MNQRRKRVEISSKNVICDFYDGGNSTQESCRENLESKKAHCYGLWKFDAETDEFKIMKKGCWLNDANCGEEPKCYSIETNQRRRIPSHVFCCCLGHHCNSEHNNLLSYYERDAAFNLYSKNPGYHTSSRTSLPISSKSFLVDSVTSPPPSLTSHSDLPSFNHGSQLSSHALLIAAITVVPICLLALVAFLIFACNTLRPRKAKANSRDKHFYDEGDVSSTYDQLISRADTCLKNDDRSLDIVLYRSMAKLCSRRYYAIPSLYHPSNENIQNIFTYISNYKTAPILNSSLVSIVYKVEWSKVFGEANSESFKTEFVVIKAYEPDRSDSWIREMRVYALLIFGLPFHSDTTKRDNKDLNFQKSQNKYAYSHQHPNLLPLIYGMSLKSTNTIKDMKLTANGTKNLIGKRKSKLHKKLDEEWQIKSTARHDLTGILITPYQDSGSLYDYLAHNLINWKILINIAMDISSALAYLHNTDNLYEYLDSYALCNQNYTNYISNSANRTNLRNGRCNTIGSDSSDFQVKYLPSDYMNTCDIHNNTTSSSYLAEDDDDHGNNTCKNNIHDIFDNHDDTRQMYTQIKSREHLNFTPTKYYKPSIVHKDVKSKNILLSTENFRLKAKLCDFGSALIMDSRDTVNKFGFKTEQNVQQKGTLRYMAPEILEGAISYSIETFLKIDVYAFALVLWELMTRCTNINDATLSNLDYKLPYEEEIGSNPTLEDMQNLVCNRNVRPKIAESWKLDPLASQLVSTLKDCWEKDPEARISSITLHERIKAIARLS
ncbi:unnamed protein product [Gordionus sp. m RMFG-2023]|uniref:uncharacterized protein LOC135929462 n=1 Tax=Gordionus sp. m RMFG-2023 TaxID=3053472 RepID=UPI0030E11502